MRSLPPNPWAQTCLTVFAANDNDAPLSDTITLVPLCRMLMTSLLRVPTTLSVPLELSEANGSGGVGGVRQNDPPTSKGTSYVPAAVTVGSAP